jgi:hypothetical protein
MVCSASWLVGHVREGDGMGWDGMGWEMGWDRGWDGSYGIGLGGGGWMDGIGLVELDYEV